MKGKLRITKQTYNYPKGDANKYYWGWDSNKLNTSSSDIVLDKTSKEYLLELLEKAEESGYTLGDFEIEFDKVLDNNTRKHVEFKASFDH